MIESVAATHPPDVESASDDVSEARAAVGVGLWVSATRCVLTYVVAPSAGVAGGFVLGSVGLILQLLGAVTSVAGARRLRSLGHRAWPAYAAVAAAVCVASIASLAGVSTGWSR